MNKKIAIIGAGGHGKVVGEIAFLNKYKVINFFDDQASQIKKFPFTISGNLKYLEEHFAEYDSFFVAIGKNNERSKIIEWLKEYNLNIETLIHPRAIVSKLSLLSEGICVMANATINPGTIINEGVIINTTASIDHDCLIDKFSHISPNCTLSGGVKVGELTHLGSGTTVHPGINIGKNVKTGIGSRVFKDILDKEIFIN